MPFKLRHATTLSRARRMQIEMIVSKNEAKEEGIRKYIKRHPKAGLEEISVKFATNETVVGKIKRNMLAEKELRQEGTLEERIKKHLAKNITSFRFGHFTYNIKAVWAAVKGSMQNQVREIAELENKRIFEETEHAVLENVLNYVTEDGNIMELKPLTDKMAADLALYPQVINYVLNDCGIYHKVEVAKQISYDLKQPLQKVGKIYFAVKNPNYSKNGELEIYKILKDLNLNVSDAPLVQQISTYPAK